MSPHCDPELEDSKPVFLPETLAHDAVSPYQVWLQKVSQLVSWCFKPSQPQRITSELLQKVQKLRRYHPDEHSLEFWTFPVTLSWTTTQQSNLSQGNPPYDDVQSNQVQLQKDKQFR